MEFASCYGWLLWIGFLHMAAGGIIPYIHRHSSRVDKNGVPESEKKLLDTGLGKLGGYCTAVGFGCLGYLFFTCR